MVRVVEDVLVRKQIFDNVLLQVDPMAGTTRLIGVELRAAAKSREGLGHSGGCRSYVVS